MYNLVQAILGERSVSKEQATKYVQVLDTFRFDSNSIINSLSRLMIVSADQFESSDAVLRDMGELLLIVSELNDLCAEREGQYREIVTQDETNREAIS
jgi:hypothetical protein